MFTATPVVPQSHGIEEVRPGSQATSTQRGSMLPKWGSARVVELLDQAQLL